MVHPDKCKHPKAQDAFEMLGQAQQALNNEDKMKELRYVLTLAQGMSQLAYTYSCCPGNAMLAMLYTSELHCLHATSFLPPL